MRRAALMTASLATLSASAAAETLTPYDTTGLVGVGQLDLVMLDAEGDDGREPVVVAEAAADGTPGVYLLAADAAPTLLAAFPAIFEPSPTLTIRLAATQADASASGWVPIASYALGPEHLIIAVDGLHSALDGSGPAMSALYAISDPAGLSPVLTAFTRPAADPSAPTYGLTMATNGRGAAWISSSASSSAYDFNDGVTIIPTTPLTVWSSAGWSTKHSLPAPAAHLLPDGIDGGFAISATGDVFLLAATRFDPPLPLLPTATEQIGSLGGPALAVAQHGPFAVGPGGELLRLGVGGVAVVHPTAGARSLTGGATGIGWISDGLAYWAAELGAPTESQRAPLVLGPDDQLRWLGDVDGDGCEELFITQLAEASALRWAPDCTLSLSPALSGAPTAPGAAAPPESDDPPVIDDPAHEAEDTGALQINPLAENDPEETIFGWGCAAAPRRSAAWIALLGAALALGRRR